MTPSNKPTQELGKSIEDSLIKANKENGEKSHSENSIQLIVKNGPGDYFFTVPITEDMKRSELAKIIGAEEIKDYNIISKQVKKVTDHLNDPKRFVNREEYLVITNDVNKTINLIENYKRGD